MNLQADVATELSAPLEASCTTNDMTRRYKIINRLLSVMSIGYVTICQEKTSPCPPDRSQG